MKLLITLAALFAMATASAQVLISVGPNMRLSASLKMADS